MDITTKNYTNIIKRLVSQSEAPPPPTTQPPKKRSQFLLSSSVEETSEYAKLQARMEDTHRHLNTSSRLRLRNNGGEIVEVQGGHIVRATDRKDRHSKVCTSKGPRERRVRLSAHTAIQFYDVQDRLGYDRPSKAVDWLIKKAKAAIDKLAELPPWHPTSGLTANQQERQQEGTEQQRHLQVAVTISAGSSSKRSIPMLGGEDEQLQMTDDGRDDDNNESFLPSSMDSDAIDDTLESFFTMGATTESDPYSVQFHQSFPLPEMLSRSTSQDLRLSLQSFQDPMLLHQQNNPQTQHHSSVSQDQGPAHSLLSGTTPMGFDVSGWSENQRMLAAWNACGDTAAVGGGRGGGAFMFSLPTTPPLLQPFGQNQMFSQRGPLQSSNTPSIRAWMDPTMAAITMEATSDSNQKIQTIPIHHSSSMSGIGFASGIAGFPGFRIPPRIQVAEEEHDGFSDKPSSTSSDSLH